MRVLLSSNGNLLGADNGFVKIDPIGLSNQECLNKVAYNPYDHFFKLPFSSIAYLVDGEIVARFPTHPSSFYPGSPFDTSKAVRVFLQEHRIILPRMYIYPTSACNTRCPICQFNFRRTSPNHIPWDLLRNAVEQFRENAHELKTPSIIISGDGEPTTYPNFKNLLNLVGDLKIRAFLTSNWVLNNTRRQEYIDSVAKNIAMITISLKGLNESAYTKYQGLRSTSKTVFNAVLNNIEGLLEQLVKSGRRSDVLVGVASLILPENTPSYRKMIEYFSNLKIDYLYLNLVEPSYQKWNIFFSESEIKDTLEMLHDLSSITSENTLVRFPRNPFNNRETVYFDAQSRIRKDICGSALWNPIIIPKQQDGIMLSCRSSDNFTQQSFWYSETLNDFSVESAMSADAQKKVMAATQGCKTCRLERHVKMFDQLIDTDSKHQCRGEFMLEFDIAKLENRRTGKVIAFEDTF